MSQKVPAFAELRDDCRRSAVHVEKRDAYAVDYETGDGASAGPSLSDDSRAVKLCSAAFESVWRRAIPHEEFKVDGHSGT